MSALGQKRTLGDVERMSALPPKADIGTQSRRCRKYYRWFWGYNFSRSRGHSPGIIEGLCRWFIFWIF